MYVLVELGSVSLMRCALKVIRETEPGEKETASKAGILFYSTIYFFKGDVGITAFRKCLLNM